MKISLSRAGVPGRSSLSLLTLLGPWLGCCPALAEAQVGAKVGAQVGAQVGALPGGQAEAQAPALAPPTASAPSAASTPATTPTTTPTTTERVVVTGNPLGRDDLAQASHVLTGDRLDLRRAATLGETLDGLAGVGASWFGPNSNRPTIRGLDGDRVRILDNAAASVDASALSFDHAVALDPLIIERVEVLRGPASLLYGGNATGGVVNTWDNRVPRQPQGQWSGRVGLRVGGAADERAGAVVLEGGSSDQAGINWHLDAYGRDADDLRVPAFRSPEDGGLSDQVRNSAANARGGALGASWADARGFAGFAVDSHHNAYGVTVEPDVLIRLQRERVQFAGERRLEGFWQKLSGHWAYTRYRHEEVEGSGEVGTTFSNQGQAFRLEAQHGAWAAGFEHGVVGVQGESQAFEALGEEAFVPGTQTRHLALFTLQEARWGASTWTAGVRVERARVHSEGDAPGGVPGRFGTAQTRWFSPVSASLSWQQSLGNGWSSTAVLGHTERAPADYELYANGLHLATAAYEQGNPALSLERSQHLDLGLQWKAAGRSLRANLYAMQFARYIALAATGEDAVVEGEDGGTEAVPIYRFEGVPARLWGLEVEARQQAHWVGWRWDGQATLDLVRGMQRDTGEPLPRLSPMRLGLSLAAARGAWTLGAGLQHAWAQTRVPATEVPTGGYTLARLWLQHKGQLAGAEAIWSVKLDNLGNELAYQAGSIRTVRALAPLPGRALSAGVEVRF